MGGLPCPKVNILFSGRSSLILTASPPPSILVKILIILPFPIFFTAELSFLWDQSFNPPHLIVLSLPPNENKHFLHLLDLCLVYLHIWLCMHLTVSVNIYIGADGEIEPSREFLTRKNFKCSLVLYFSCSCSKERRPSVRSVSNKLNSITLRERFIKKKKKLNKIVLPLHLPTSSKNYKNILFFPICRKMRQKFC